MTLIHNSEKNVLSHNIAHCFIAIWFQVKHPQTITNPQVQINAIRAALIIDKMQTFVPP